MLPLFEQYRPSAWSEVIGQEKAVNKVKTLLDRGIGGRAFWIAGQSGTGKTTIAKLIGAEIADVDFVEEIDATDLTPAKLRKVENTMSLFSWGKGGRCYIVNEAHGLSRPAIRQLLVLLERLPSHAVFIFTTTIEGQELLFEDKEDTSPLLSRCIKLDLARRNLCQGFASRAREIADIEGLNGQPIEKYVRLVQDCKNNMRAVLQAIESGEMLGRTSKI